MGQNGRWRRAMVDRIVPASPGRVLDVASGTAGVALQLAGRTSADVVGVDLTMGMLGQGRRNVAQAGLSERVHWPGMLNGDVKWGSFFASEVFILPSHQENFGMAVAEAMACGRAVLLADKVNIAPEIAADGAGLMELDTQDGTDNLVRRWIEMPHPERQAMEQRAVETFDRRYDMEKNAATINRVFETVPRQT